MTQLGVQSLLVAIQLDCLLAYCSPVHEVEEVAKKRPLNTCASLISGSLLIIVQRGEPSSRLNTYKTVSLPTVFPPATQLQLFNTLNCQ